MRQGDSVSQARGKGRATTDQWPKTLLKNSSKVSVTHMLASDPLSELEHWASVRQRKGAPMNSHLFKQQLLSLLKRHRHGWGPAPADNTWVSAAQLLRENIVVRSLASTHRNSISRLRALLGQLSSVRTGLVWSPVLSTTH